jgi:hypothetical protein
MSRWWKRFWLRYLYYFKQHWIIAASLALSLLWVLVQLGRKLINHATEV